MTTDTRTIDLNCDMGEGFGIYSFGDDIELLKLISSANIACGFHAGDPHTMHSTVRACLNASVAIGAHPGLPDRLGFGRRFMQVSPEEIYDYMLYQVGALQAFIHAQGGTLQHVKPHGALYHMANTSQETASAITRAMLALGEGVKLYAQSGSLLLETARTAGLHVIAETFADRRYAHDGSLVPRGVEGALLDVGEAAEQAVLLASGEAVPTLTGQTVSVEADSICIHGDGAHAAELAALIGQKLTDAGISVSTPDKKSNI